MLVNSNNIIVMFIFRALLPFEARGFCFAILQCHFRVNEIILALKMHCNAQGEDIINALAANDISTLGISIIVRKMRFNV